MVVHLLEVLLMVEGQLQEEQLKEVLPTEGLLLEDQTMVVQLLVVVDHLMVDPLVVLLLVVLMVEHLEDLIMAEQQQEAQPKEGRQDMLNNNRNLMANNKRLVMVVHPVDLLTDLVVEQVMPNNNSKNLTLLLPLEDLIMEVRLLLEVHPMEVLLEVLLNLTVDHQEGLLREVLMVGLLPVVLHLILLLLLVVHLTVVRLLQEDHLLMEGLLQEEIPIHQELQPQEGILMEDPVEDTLMMPQSFQSLSSKNQATTTLLRPLEEQDMEP